MIRMYSNCCYRNLNIVVVYITFIALPLVSMGNNAATDANIERKLRTN